ncbi:GntR family transcriptional regulator [Acetobacter sp.]|uniref:GntR family transcriptional regulator n=2 Tax=Acetobacter sp. TaxID=440 RepID=UPI0039EBEF2D
MTDHTHLMAISSSSSQPRRSSSQLVYDTLREDILVLARKPGEMLDETELAERFGLSRSPVREALIRLAGEGLVVMLASRSTVVAPIDIASFPSYVAALDLAQRANTRLAAICRTEGDLKTIQARQAAFIQAVEGGEHLAMSEANKQFHLAIAHAGRNAYFIDFYERLLNQGQRMLHLHFAYLERSNENYLLTEEHQLMLDAIAAKDADEAERLAHMHTRQFQQNFIDFMRETYTASMTLDGSGAERVAGRAKAKKQPEKAVGASAPRPAARSRTTRVPRTRV